MQPTSPTEPVYRPPSLWVTLPVILLCLAGGGFIIRLYVKTSPLAHETTQLGDAATPPTVPPAAARAASGFLNGARQMLGGGGNRRGNGGNGGGNGGAPAIRTVNGDTVVQTAKAQVRFGMNRSGRTGFEQANYRSDGFIPREARNTAAALPILLGTPEGTNVAAMKLTDAQKTALLKVRRSPGMVVGAADRTALDADYLAYRDAAGRDRSAAAAAEAKLLRTVDEVADRSAEPTKQAWVAEAAQINAVVTADQWKIYEANGNGH